MNLILNHLYSIFGFIKKLFNSELTKLAFLFLWLISCDFTPRVQRKVLEAQSLISEQKYKEAVGKYQEILEENPKDELEVKILYQIGDLYSIYLFENEASLPFYRNILKISQDPLWQVKTIERLAEINFTFLKKYGVSEGYYNTLANYRPRLTNHNFYLFRLGLSQYEGHSYKEAIKTLNKVQSVKSDYSVQALFYLGLTYFQTKQWSRAISFWNEYIGRESRSDKIIEAKFLLANAYESMERLKKAYSLYYSLLGPYPNTEVIQNRLKAIYERRVARKR